MPLAEWQKLFALSDQYGFVLASDECYSEIYFRDEPPLGGLQAAAQLGRTDFKRLLALTSLSKRSNVPGMRSGFVAGDADILAVPDLESGNMLAKQLEYLAGASGSGLVLGAAVPIALTSRADGPMNRAASALLAKLAAHSARRDRARRAAAGNS
jgi:aspartate/methionine/tyrosine aminotransferase